MAEPLKATAARATWWSAMEVSARYGVQFVVMVVLARLLPPSTFGLLAMLLVFTSFGALLLDSGFGTALVQRRDTTPDDETTVFLFSFAVSVLAGMALWFAAPAIAGFYGQPVLERMTAVMAWQFPLLALAIVPDAMLTRRLNFRARTWAEVVASLLSGAVGVTMAFLGFGVWSLVAQTLLGAAVRATLVWFYSAWRPRGHFSRSAFKAMFRFGGFLLLSNLLDTITLRLQSLIIGRLFDSSTLGYYTLAQNTQQAPASFFGSILNRVGLPVFSSVAHDVPTLREALRASLRVSMFVFFPCMLGLALVAAPLIQLIYGSKWLVAAPMLTILAASASFWPLHVLNLAAINALGRSDLFFRLAVLKKIIAIALIILASTRGPLAIAWSILVANLVAVAINTHYARALFDYGIGQQIKDQTGTLIAAAIAGAAGFSVMHWCPPSTWSTIAAIVLAALLYIGASFAGGSHAMRECLDILSALRRNRPPQPSLSDPTRWR